MTVSLGNACGDFRVKLVLQVSLRIKRCLPHNVLQLAQIAVQSTHCQPGQSAETVMHGTLHSQIDKAPNSQYKCVEKKSQHKPRNKYNVLCPAMLFGLFIAEGWLHCCEALPDSSV